MATSKHSPSLDHIVEDLNALNAYLRYSTLPPQSISQIALWVDPTDFHNPTAQSQQQLQQAIQKNGYGSCKKSTATALLLRLGWSAGLQIGAWLVHDLVLLGLRQHVAFNQQLALVSGVAVEHCTGILQRQQRSRDILRKQLAQELVSQITPAVEAYHHWSGISRAALWAMVCSGWASQFIVISERLGRPDQALFEAQRVFSLHGTVSHVQPTLYAVSSKERIGICQKRHLCCLWFKSSPRSYCSSCPILPTEERLAQNQRWIREHGLTPIEIQKTKEKIISTEEEQC